MKSLQQLKPVLSFYKRASMLLFFFCISTAGAQGLYYKEGTEITILENTVVYVSDSGTISENRLKNFKDDAIIQNKTEHTVSDKKSKPLSKEIKKEWAGNNPKKVKTEPRPKPILLMVPTPDNFFLNYQKGEAISALVPPHNYPGYPIDHKTLQLSYGYSINDNNKIPVKNSIFCKDSYLFQYTTRPPPYKLI
ncbi:hypothetical protein [Chryseobacterium aureum]|uniref:hypothetical protein n=1 Tax=Chryseobacterium aureum TaxID=2497456 RepID=UPI000F893A99|nr:hypothetical protein [Chryseobacterium aureum]